MSNPYPRQRFPYSRPIVQTSHRPSNWRNDGWHWLKRQQGRLWNETPPLTLWSVGDWDAGHEKMLCCSYLSRCCKMANATEENGTNCRCVRLLRSGGFGLLTVRWGRFKQCLICKRSEKERRYNQRSSWEKLFCPTPRFFPVSADWFLEFQLKTAFFQLKMPSWY